MEQENNQQKQAASNNIRANVEKVLERDEKWTVGGGVSPLSPIYHFKILVPAAAAGRIIGKGGTTIAQLQKNAGASVKMSKASEFYPGTTERVCLISGPMEGILKINDFFMENFSSTSIKILVPNSTAGMIIGKGGSYIKQIKEESGAYVQISQKCTEFSLPERCVTVVGELGSIRKACIMILNKIVEDVGSAFRDIRASSMTASMISHHNHHQNNNNNYSTSSCSSTSSPQQSPNHHHSHNNHHNHHHHSLSSPQPLAAAATAAAYGHLQHSISPPLKLSPPVCTPVLSSSSSSSLTGSQTQISNSTNSSSSTSCITSPATSTSSSVASSASSVWSDMNSAQIIETIKLVLRVSGYGEDAVSEISSAMSTLAIYGVLGVGLGLL